MGAAICLLALISSPASLPADDTRAVLIKRRNDLAWEALRYRHARRPDEAVAAVEKMLLIERRAFTGEDPDLAGALEFSAVFYAYRGDFEPAARAIREAAEIRARTVGRDDWRTIDDRYELERLGWLTKIGPDRLARYRELVGLNETAGRLGRRVHQVREAVVTLQKATDLARELLGSRSPEYATYLDRLGDYVRMTMRGHGEEDPARTRAESLYREAQAIRREVLGEGHPHMARSYENLYQVAPRTDMAQAVTEAVPPLRKALAIRVEALGENHPQTAGSCRVLAQALASQPGADSEEIQALYRRAIESDARCLGDDDLITDSDRDQFARWLATRGRPDEAATLLARVVEHDRKRLVDRSMTRRVGWLSSLGPLADFEELADLNRLNSSGRYASLAGRLARLAEIRGQLGEATTAARLTLESIEVSNRGFELMASVRSGSGTEPMAANSTTFLISRLLALAVDPTAGMDLESVYAEAIAWKGAYLARDLRGRRWRTRPELEPLFAELDRIVADLARQFTSIPRAEDQAAWEKIRVLTGRRSELEAELGLRLTRFDREVAGGKATVSQLRELLPDGAALVDYHVFRNWKGWGDLQGTEEHLLAFVVLPGRPVVIKDLGPVAPIRRAVDTWLAAMAPKFEPARPGRPARIRLDDPGPSGRLIRQLVWEPIERDIGSIRLLLVSPEQVLSRFPFAALPGPTPGASLVESFAVGTVPVPRLLVTGNPFDPSPPSLLLVGDVDFDAQPGAPLTGQDLAVRQRGAAGPAMKKRAIRFPRLAATARELDVVRRHFEAAHPGSPVDVLRGPAATEQSFRKALKHPRFVHLATHGFFLSPQIVAQIFGRVDNQDYWTGNPLGLARVHPGLLSGIVFAGANRPASPDRDDGILTAAEAQQLDLAGTDLVVLSACETALGTATRGEGLMGLQRAFQVSGARSLVSSLWSVDDHATATLMDEFYANLWTGNLARHEALRRAQLRIIREYDPTQRKLVPRATAGATATRPPLHPYYWAAFILSGDSR